MTLGEQMFYTVATRHTHTRALSFFFFFFFQVLRECNILSCAHPQRLSSSELVHCATLSIDLERMTWLYFSFEIARTPGGVAVCRMRSFVHVLFFSCQQRIRAVNLVRLRKCVYRASE